MGQQTQKTLDLGKVKPKPVLKSKVTHNPKKATPTKKTSSQKSKDPLQEKKPKTSKPKKPKKTRKKATPKPQKPILEVIQKFITDLCKHPLPDMIFHNTRLFEYFQYFPEFKHHSIASSRNPVGPKVFFQYYFTHSSGFEKFLLDYLDSIKFLEERGVTETYFSTTRPNLKHILDLFLNKKGQIVEAYYRRERKTDFDQIRELGVKHRLFDLLDLLEKHYKQQFPEKKKSSSPKKEQPIKPASTTGS